MYKRQLLDPAERPLDGGRYLLVGVQQRAVQIEREQTVDVYKRQRLLFPIRRKNIKIYVKKITIRDKTGKTRKLQNARLRLCLLYTSRGRSSG